MVLEKNVTENILEPVSSEDTMIPESLLKNFICACKNNCSDLAVKCNKYCKSCKGSSCLNSEMLEDMIPPEISIEPEVIEADINPTTIIPSSTQEEEEEEKD